MKPTLSLLLVLAVCAGVAAAASLPLETLPANAKWVVQLDAKALGDSPPGRDLLAALADSPQDAELKAFEAAFACDVRRDLAAVTACGAGGAEQGGVVYLRGNWDLRKLSAGLAATKPFATVSYGRHTIMSWSDAKASNGAERQSVCLVSANLVLLSNREPALRQALDVLDGRAPTLASEPRFRRMAAMDTNAFLRVVAADLKDIVADSPQADLLPAGDSLRLAVSMEGQDVCAKAVMKASTPEAAQQMQQVLIGFQAVMMLQGMKNPDVGKIARAARIDVNGLDVRVVLTASVETVKHLLLGRPEKGPKPPVPARPIPPTPVSPARL